MRSLLDLINIAAAKDKSIAMLWRQRCGISSSDYKCQQRAFQAVGHGATHLAKSELEHPASSATELHFASASK